MRLGGQRHASGCFTPGKKTRYPLHRRLGGRLGQYGWVRESPSPPEFDSRTVPLASHYTDCTILSHTVSTCSTPIFEFVLFGCSSAVILDSPVLLAVKRNQEDVVDNIMWELRTKVTCYQWRTEGGLGISTPPPKFRNFDKAEPNSQFHGKYNRNNLIRIRV
jgi:hypothetical protein